MPLHAFVAMPFGTKDGIDFDWIYAELIRPALENAGYEAFRADEEVRAGEIRKDMFQELLLADLVIVDASIDNPNVWYELGVRHALRDRDVITIACREGRLPFDIASDRVLRYHRKDGAPDPLMLKKDTELLTRFVTETMRAKSDDDYRCSPVYQLIPALKEPDWHSLVVKGATGFWNLYDVWRDRVEVARRQNRAGDILVLADETPTWVLRNEARRMAGSALIKLNQPRLALLQYETACADDPRNLDSQQKIGVLLGRLGRHEEAREWINNLIEKCPSDPEAWSLLGRVEKNEWITRWRVPGSTAADLLAAARAAEALLAAAIEPYTTAFLLDPRHFYSGINALALSHLQRHLGCECEASVSLSALEGGVAWGCCYALKKAPKDYWARVTCADLNLFIAGVDTDKVVRAYRSAIAAAGRDWFALDSSRQQLSLLRDLDFRPELVYPALAAFDQELARIAPPWRPRQVLLFSGHMIDKPDRSAPRFPAAMEPAVRAAVAATLAELNAGPDDLALCSGACGGDLIFAEAALACGARLEIHIPFTEPGFLEASVTFAGDAWRRRFNAVKANPLASLLLMPERLGPLPANGNAYARNNLWMLYTALAHGPEKVRFVSLWDGKRGDGEGGTEHMVETVRRHSGEVYVIDTKALLNEAKGNS